MGEGNDVEKGQTLNFISSAESRYRNYSEQVSLSMRIAQGVLDNSIPINTVSEIIANTESIKNSYPELSIPGDFFIERPNVFFRSLHLSKYRQRTILYNCLKESGVAGLKITKPEELEKSLLEVKKMTGIPGIEKKHLEDVCLTLIYGVYFANLELYRLVKDKTGAVMRFARKDSELERPSKLKEDGSWFISQEMKEICRGRLVMYWYRKEARYKEGWYPERYVVIKTLEELEKDHLVTLDPAEDCALAAIEI